MTHGCIQSLLLKFSAQELIEVRQPTSTSSATSSTSSSTVVVAVDHTKLWPMIGSGAGAQRTGVKRKAEDQSLTKRAGGFSPSLQSSASPPHSSTTSLTPASSLQLAGSSALGSGADKKGRSSKCQSSHLDMEIESLLNQQSTKEQQSKKVPRMKIPTSFHTLQESLLEGHVCECFFCVGEQRDSRAAECQHGQGAVHRRKVPVPRPGSGAGVLRPRDKRGVHTFWRHPSAMHQATFPVRI